MEQPVIAQKSPIPVDLKKGETYYYCTCFSEMGLYQ